MPKIYEYFGLVFFFNANDHNPIHIHVSHGEYQSKIEFIYSNGILKDILVKKVSGYKPVPAKTIKDALSVAKIKSDDIANKWFGFYAKNITPKCVKITKKL